MHPETLSYVMLKYQDRYKNLERPTLTTIGEMQGLSNTWVVWALKLKIAEHQIPKSFTPTDITDLKYNINFTTFGDKWNPEIIRLDKLKI